jgi:predicted nucleotidyltransferase
MDLAFPMGSVVPGAYGVILSVLARTDQPLSGRQLSELTDGRVSQRRTNDVLSAMSVDGIVDSESRPPAILYSLNRDHVAAAAIEMLTRMREQLQDQIAQTLASWKVRPIAAWLYGSLAAGRAGRGSDIDILVIRPDSVDETATVWEDQIDTLTVAVRRWSGNQCEVLEMTETEFTNAIERDDRLIRDLRDHGVALAGHSPEKLRKSRRKAAR